jgi:hypothetical protein
LRRRNRKVRLSCFPTAHQNAEDTENQTPNINNNNKRQRKESSSVADAMADEEDDDDDDDVWVRGYLNITSAMHAKDGFICVAVETSCVRLRNAVKQVQNLYVGPQHLRLVKDNDENAQIAWQDAIPYIIL